MYNQNTTEVTDLHKQTKARLKILSIVCGHIKKALDTITQTTKDGDSVNDKSQFLLTFIPKVDSDHISVLETASLTCMYNLGFESVFTVTQHKSLLSKIGLIVWY